MTPRAGLGSQPLVSSEEYAAAKEKKEGPADPSNWKAEGMERARKRFKSEG